MKQKTVRFYEESKADMEAYEKLECFREYGFNNAREFIIVAVNRYAQEDNYSPDALVDVDRIAEIIIEKMKCIGGVLQMIEEKEAANHTENDEVFDKALNFIENL